MKTGVSETFDEHESDTARRAYPQEIVDGTRRTTKMPKVDLAALRTESGTRPVLTHDAIERHVRERMWDALAEAERSSGIEVDPHSRPTVAAGLPVSTPRAHEGEWSVDALAASTPLPMTPPAASSRPTPLTAAISVPSPDRPPIPGWVVATILAGLFVLLSAAGAFGFVLGRHSARP